MKKFLRLLVLAAFGLASGGCSLLAEYRPMGDKELVINKRGHVVGHRQVVRHDGSEPMLRVTLYTPRLNDDGKVIGYEERTRSGAVIRDLAGNHIGNRFSDLRSRGTNPGNTGITVVFGPAEPRERISLAAAFNAP